MRDIDHIAVYGIDLMRVMQHNFDFAVFGFSLPYIRVIISRGRRAL
jgi:hypothetical protein